jgi:BAAT / Acyl-CoA thioester hydrolase C terminal
LIPAGTIKGPILLFSAADDRVWPSAEMCDMMMHTLRDRGFSCTDEHIT